MVVGDDIEVMLDEALRLSDTGQTEVLYFGQDDALTRFANSQIHQNVREHDRSLQVRVVDDHRVGVASTNQLDRDGLRDVVARAMAIAARAQPNPRAGHLPEPGERGAFDPEAGYVAATAEATPERRGSGAREVIAAGLAEDLIVSGAFATSRLTVAVANSLGVRSRYTATRADLVTVMMDGFGGNAASGYARGSSSDIDEIDPAAIGREAADKGARSRGASELEPGEYEVVLEEYAVATVLEYLAFIGFSALALEERRSFMELGKRVMGDNVSIWDDGHDPAGIPSPADFEGVTRQRVDLVREGVASAVVHDAATASRFDTTSTGHALPAPNVWGPIPANLFMAPGGADRQQLLAGMRRGVWVTRFHYVNPVHPKKAILTGMTKDGTFLVENGQFVRPIMNLRFTQSIPQAFSSIEAITEQTKVIAGEYFGAYRVPALRCERFNFTGVTAREEPG